MSYSSAERPGGCGELASPAAPASHVAGPEAACTPAYRINVNLGKLMTFKQDDIAVEQ